MAFTFPVDTNSKAGAVRENPSNEGFHTPAVLYGANGVTPSTVKKVKKVYGPTGGIGYGHTIAGAQEFKILENHEFDAGTGSWGLNFMEVNRTDSNMQRVKIRVTMHDTLNPTGLPNHGGQDYSFMKTIEISSVDEIDKALGILSDASTGRLNVLLGGKPFNVPTGKYLTVSIINTYEATDIMIKGFTLTEYGWF